MAGCSFSLVNNFQRIPEAPISRNEVIPWFQGDTNRFLFHAGIDIYRNHFSGLMIVKPFTDTSHRVLFITETGIKIFDMEFFRSGDYQMHYCMEVINRRSVIRMLKNDIGLMLNSIPESAETTMLKDRQTGRTVIRSKDNRGVTFSYIEDTTKRVNEIMNTRGLTKKVNMIVYSADGAEIDSVDISHYTVKLNIHLSKLDENKPEISE